MAPQCVWCREVCSQLECSQLCLPDVCCGTRCADINVTSAMPPICHQHGPTGHNVDASRVPITMCPVGPMRRTSRMRPHHVFTMCPPETPDWHFKCLHDVPTGKFFGVHADHILNVFADPIVNPFQVYLKCDHNVPTGFSVNTLRRNLNNPTYTC